MRVVDPALIPNIPPNEYARKLMIDHVESVRVALEAAEAQVAHLRAGILELEAGRYEGFIMCSVDQIESLQAMTKALAAEADLDRQIKAMDPAYQRACEAVRHETSIRAHVISATSADPALFDAFSEAHAKICKDPNCKVREIFKRAELRKMGGQ